MHIRDSAARGYGVHCGGSEWKTDIGFDTDYGSASATLRKGGVHSWDLQSQADHHWAHSLRASGSHGHHTEDPEGAGSIYEAGADLRKVGRKNFDKRERRLKGKVSSYFSLSLSVSVP